MINVFSSSFAKQDNVGELNKTKPEKGNTEFDLLPLVNTTQTRVRGPGAYLGKMISGVESVNHSRGVRQLSWSEARLLRINKK